MESVLSVPYAILQRLEPAFRVFYDGVVNGVDAVVRFFGHTAWLDSLLRSAVSDLSTMVVAIAFVVAAMIVVGYVTLRTA